VVGLPAAPGDRDAVPDASEELAMHRAGCSLVAGLDEAGRGAWAGPVVAGAAILPPLDGGIPAELSGVRDSKMLTPGRRAELYDLIVGCCRAVAVGSASADEVDRCGLTVAGELAMLRAARRLPTLPDALVIDWFGLPGWHRPQKAVVKGDTRCISIAAASIVAKVTRDRWMGELDARYPGYGLREHKGYGTPAHRLALVRLGPSPVHRRSYAPVAALTQVVTA
jgi:ribonuclease HII